MLWLSFGDGFSGFPLERKLYLSFCTSPKENLLPPEALLPGKKELYRFGQLRLGPPDAGREWKVLLVGGHGQGLAFQAELG